MKIFARTLKQVRSTLLLLLSIVSLPVTATDFITDVMLIGAGNKQDLDNLKSQYQAQGWSILNKDFNAGIDWGKGDGVLLLYKTATCADGYNHGYITDLYLQNKSAANTTNTLNFNGRVYNLVPFDGSQHFINVKGDLNSGTGSGTDAIHLYYTKEHFADNRAITNIYINNSSSGAVGREDTHSAYNLNAGCSTGEDIFLHTSTATAPFKDCYFTDVMLIGAGSSSELSTIKNTYTSQGWKVIDYDLNKGIDWGNGEAIYLLYKEQISPDGVNHNYITDFYLQNESAANTNDTLVFRDQTYELVPYEGSQHFKNVKGDLNSGTGENTDPIHLYYTRQRDLTNGTTITGIFFNNHPEDSITVWKEGDKYPYDLNSGCSALTQEKIYMHYTIASTWKGLSPKVELSECKLQGRSIKISGWAYDPDESEIPIRVTINLFFLQHRFVHNHNTRTSLEDEVWNASQGISGKHYFEMTYDIPSDYDSDTIEVAVNAVDVTGDESTQIAPPILILKNNMPKSALESFQAQTRGFSIKGWAYDPDYPNDSTKIKVVIKSNTNNNIYKTLYIDTDQNRTDVNSTEGIDGYHGFSTYIPFPHAPAGTYTVFIYAIDNNQKEEVPVGVPQTINIIRAQPKSDLEKVEVTNNSLLIQGWAYQPDYPDEPTKIKVVMRNNTNNNIYKTLYIDTDQNRTDVNSTEGIDGNHGFNTYISISDAHAGTYTVFIYAIDNDQEDATPIGEPQNITIIRTQPKCGLEIIEVTDDGVLVQGWAYDPDESKKSIPIRLEIKNQDGSVYKTWTLDSTNVKRDDINEQYNITGTHGFRNVVKIGKSGTFYVNIYACDITGEEDMQMGNTQTIVFIAVETYSLWIGSTQVTSLNKDNILNQFGEDSTPTAVFNPETNTLTLNEPLISGFYKSSVIYADGINLTIKGEYHYSITQGEFPNPPSDAKFIQTYNGNLTLDGDFLIDSNYYGIATDSLFIKSGTVIVKNRQNNGILCYKECHVSGKVRYVDIFGGASALSGTRVKAPGHNITTPSNARIIYETIYEPDGVTMPKHIVLEPKNESFKVWIGNKPVTSDNFDDIFDDGKAVFNPETNTLTLNNPTITGYHTFDDNRTAVIYSEVDDLTIKGTFKQAEATAQYCIATAGGNLSMAGDFDLTGTIAGVRCDTLKAQNGTTNLTLTGGTKASESTDIVVGNWLNPLSPNVVIINGTFYNKIDGSTFVKQVTLTGYATNPFFNLWLGNTQVTQFNKKNILNQTDSNGRATATFDPSSATLTLNNPDISGVHNNSKIETRISGLTIKGEYHMTTAEKDYGLECLSSYKELCILDGNFTFLGKKCGINTMDKMIVKSGTLKAVGSSECGIEAFKSLIIKAEVSHIEIEGGKMAVELYRTGHLTCEGTLGLSTPLYGIHKLVPDTYANTIYDTNSNTIAKKIIIEPGHKNYDLWVGSKRVTGNNYMDILGDGKVSFNPNNKTLTLNEPIINDSHNIIDGNSTATIMAQGMDLTIKGKYNMSQANADFGVLVSEGTLTLDGDFTLYGNKCGASSSSNYSDRGVYTYHNYGTTLIGNIKLIGQEYGLNSGGETTLNGTIHIKGENKGLFSNLSIYVNEGTLATIEATESFSIDSYNDKEKNTRLVINGGVIGLIVNNGVRLNDMNILNGDGQNTQIINHKNARFDPANKSVMEDGKEIRDIKIGNNYKIFVGNNLVTSLNCDDILGDGGKAIFDPKTNTLFMDSPEIDDYVTDANGKTVKIDASDINLTINGVYHMKDTTDYGLYMRNGNITLDGSFTFNAHNVALDCLEGTLTIKSNEANNIILNGGEGYKTLFIADLVFEDGMIVETPQNYEFSLSKMTIIDLDNTENRAANPIVISYKAKDSTMIQNIKSRSYYPETDLWYDMYGRKLNEMPTVKGLYIHKGRIVLIE